MSRILGGVLVVLALLASGGAVCAQAQAAPGQEPVENSFFTNWGEAGQPGSYRVWFDRRGASVWSIWLLDHFQTVEAAAVEAPTYEEYYRVVRAVEPEGQPLEPFFRLVAVDDPNNLVFPLPIDGEPNAAGVQQAWEVTERDGAVVFSLDGGEGLVLEKEFRPRPGRREFELLIRLRATGDPGPKGGGSFSVNLLGPMLANPSGENVIGNPAVAIGQQMQAGQPGEVVTIAPAAEPATRVVGGGRANPVYFAGTTNRFFGSFFYPLDETSSNALWAVDTDSHPRFRNEALDIEPHSVPRAIYRLRLPIPAAEGDATTVSLGVYLGPKSYRVFDENPDYQRFAEVMAKDLRPACGFCTIPGAAFMASVLLKLLGFFQGFAVNWGLAIIMLTLLVRGLLAPLNFRMQKSMRAFGVKMSKLKPQMDEMKKRYESDPKAYQRKMMEFNREHKIVPPIGGCLPIFLTMPVWIGLFTALRVAYDLRQEPFMLWVNDLSRPDALIEGGLSWMPFYFTDFNLLPLIMMGLWFWAQSSTPLPADPQQRQMMKIMRFLPFVFGIMLYNYASGLMLYMITSSAWALVEMRITRRILGPMPSGAGMTAPMTPM